MLRKEQSDKGGSSPQLYHGQKKKHLSGYKKRERSELSDLQDSFMSMKILNHLSHGCPKRLFQKVAGLSYFFL